MSEIIILSKIAKLAVGNNKCSNNQSLSFSFQNKLFILLDEFKDDAENILKLVREAENSHRKEIALVSNMEGAHLVVQYKNPIRNQTDYFIENLFAAIYTNYKKPLSPKIKEKNVINTYVLGKIYEFLQLQHYRNIEDLTNKMQNKLSLPQNFKPKLREYQRKSIMWMLKREMEPDSFPAFFKKFLAKDKVTIIYKHLFTRFIQTYPPDKIILPPGGILADEMGLGKTVEMLALIIANPCLEINLNPTLSAYFSTLPAKRRRCESILFCICNSNSKTDLIQCQKCNLWQHQECVMCYESKIDNSANINKYVCPACWHYVIQEYGLLKSKATLIVSPNTIKMQWASEIKRHVQPTLRVFIYEGVIPGKWISPRHLAEYDVVLTDYNILRRDIYYTKENACERKTRNKPRCMRVNTSILMLKWWRVVLDEAQMVESKQSKVASLARMIPAINRWAVTGTPIQKSLKDLQPLLQFIGFEAASESSVWDEVVNQFLLSKYFKKLNPNADYPIMIYILQKCMWRTCKRLVASELHIPPQQEIVHRIQFDNLEKLFYNEQHFECHRKFLDNARNFSQRVSTISSEVMNSILQPFLKIRQSCTTPVVMSTCTTRKNFNSYQQIQFLNPKELNDYLKSEYECYCKCMLRVMTSSHNGLGALYILQKNFDLAIKNYEAVLKLAKDYSELNIPVDSLLQIHALHNIMQIKMLQPNMSIENIEWYENLHNKLEWKYLSTYASNLATAKTAYKSAIEKVNVYISDNFVINMAECIQTLSVEDELILIQKIQDECLSRFQSQKNKIMKLNEIRSARTLLYVIKLWFNELNNILTILQNDIKQLEYFIENVRSRNQVSPDVWRNINRLVNSVYDCHLSEIRKSKNVTRKQKRPSEKKKLCEMCTLRNSINSFECLLLNKVIDKSTNYTEGFESPSLEVCLCKITFHYIKSKGRYLCNMDKHWLYLENLQLICKRLIKFWIEMEYTIKAYDELNMCKMRITLTEDVGDKSTFKVMESEIDQRIIDQERELKAAEGQLRTKLPRLKYIKHLEGNDDPSPCPICRLTENDKYVVLECGHHICFLCFKSSRLYIKGKFLKCSICRNFQHSEKIYYVSRSKIKNVEDEIIRGHYSSKITYIVRLILKLRSQQNEGYELEPSFQNDIEFNNVKILIFSQWDIILQAIALALKENEIKYRAKYTPKAIEEFKNPELGITCLLMPFVRGSKGLNLVEATHVFLVEPILNPGEELQALARVHRIGQKRRTTVHRFIVNQTIEENIYDFIKSSSSYSNNSASIKKKWEFDYITLGDFNNFFSLPQAPEDDSEK